MFVYFTVCWVYKALKPTVNTTARWPFFVLFCFLLPFSNGAGLFVNGSSVEVATICLEVVSSILVLLMYWKKDNWLR